jgi:hypothetical protein
MPRKAPVVKASLAAAFVAAGGAAASQAQAAANPDSASVEGIVSSYYGPLNLMSSFEKWIDIDSGGIYESFAKFYKFDQQRAVNAVFRFSAYKEIPPPPGFDQTGGD